MAKPHYGAEHQRRAAELKAKAYGTRCPGCGEVMLRGQALDAAHSVDVVVDPSAKADHVRHAVCNRRDGGRVGSTRSRMRPSRSW